ncbi:MAG TPA: 50S ribosomal protein L11 methyltransferase [Bacteroidales bacterium]|nr:50S ribosomal protein L11 methyltransferase [Bacteroidales bacterium]
MFIKAGIQFSTGDNSFPERIIAALSLTGCEGIEELPHKIEAWFRAESFSETTLREILKPFFQEESSLLLETEAVHEIDWNAEWEKNFLPVVVNPECRIRAPFHQFPVACTYDIIIEPKMAFGTGHHATTFLMLEEMLKIEMTGKKILDAGTGTGVLSVLASMRGASSVIACDVDRHAVENAEENFRHNTIHNVILVHGSIKEIDETGFDGILANINKNVLVSEMPQYVHHLKENGFLLCSGFFREDADEIIQIAEKNSLKVGRMSGKDGWAALYFRKTT